MICFLIYIKQQFLVCLKKNHECAGHVHGKCSASYFGNFTPLMKIFPRHLIPSHLILQVNIAPAS